MFRHDVPHRQRARVNAASLHLGLLRGLCGCRPHPSGRARLLRIPLLAAASGIVGVLVWGYIANQSSPTSYRCCSLPAVWGLINVWHRIRPRRVTCPSADPSCSGRAGGRQHPLQSGHRKHAVGLSRLAGIPVQNTVHLQESISSVTGNPIDQNVRRGSALPVWAPADTLLSSIVAQRSTSPTASSTDLGAGRLRPRQASCHRCRSAWQEGEWYRSAVVRSAET